MTLNPLRDPQREEPVGICPICNRKVWPGDPAVKTECGIAHLDCSEPFSSSDVALAEQFMEESE
jgi:hypothetical protein